MFPDQAWDEGLDEAQLAAATHGCGPLVVAAGAGTGKTRALTARLACLLERGVEPQRILLLTFTRRAAEDMLARAARFAGLGDRDRPRGGTFHSVARSHVAAHAEVVGLPKGFGVLDPGEACDLMDLLRGDHELSGAGARYPRSSTLVEIYSRCINHERPLREVLPTEYPWCEPHQDAISGLFRDFTARKRRSALLDFDDLLLYWCALLRHEQLGAKMAEQFSFVLVDEYQDVNSLQIDILRLIAPRGRGLTLVGDQAQAIYGFRGSDPVHLRDVIASYPDATVIRLEKNFRSRPAILDVANAVRPDDGDRLRLTSDRGRGQRPTLLRCYDAPSEARAVVDRILDAHEGGIPLRSQAVLVRASHHSDLIEVELSARKVPYRKYGGLRFLEAAHVKDFVAAARLTENSHDEVAWYRVLRLHRRIGPARARSLIESFDPSVSDPLSRWPEIVAEAPPQARGPLSNSLGALNEARHQSAPGARMTAVLEAVRPLIRDRYDDAAARLADLERLAGAASAVEDVVAWLAELTLDPPASTGNLAGEPHLDEDYVVISTIHSAKGLEWAVVHLPHLVDGAVPIDMALRSAEGIHEEQRLLYVAVTRARDVLHLYAPLRMPHHRHGHDDRHSFAQLSRFLDAGVQTTLDIAEEPRPLTEVVGTVSGSVSVDLDPLWA